MLHQVLDWREVIVALIDIRKDEEKAQSSETAVLNN